MNHKKYPIENTPKVFTIILNWNGRDETLECLANLKKENYRNNEVIVVDNCSDKDELSIIKKKFPKIICIQNKKNLGFSEGNNVGIRYALKQGANFIFLLNNDAKVREGCIKKLVSEARKKGVGITGPKIYHYGTSKIQSCGDHFMAITGFTYHLKRNRKDTFRVNFVPGTAMMIDANALKIVGLLDSKLFAYYEDVDLCLRMYKAGYYIKAVPSAEAEHKVSDTTKGTTLKTYLKTRNTFYIMIKHSLDNPIFRIWFFTIFLANEMRKNLSKPLAIVNAVIRGIKDSYQIEQSNHAISGTEKFLMKC